MTRLEVATAFAVAVVIVIGASLIFKVVERNAGNARAMSKLLAFRQVVEEYSSQGLGYPDIEQARTMWSRNRQRDFLLSPWGGQVGVSLNQASGSRGIEGVPFFDILAVRRGFASRAGGIGYMVAPQANQTVKLIDAVGLTVIVVRDFGCFYHDPDGAYPVFPTGGAPPTR